METVWFVLWGFLWGMYFVLGGFDLGLGALLPALGRTDKERRVIINATGPFWDGNEVWLIAAGGMTFAAFPPVYAAMFSAMYLPLMLVLFSLIVRGVAFEFRARVESARWRRFWDACMTVGSWIPALLFGVAFGNLFRGIPIGPNGAYKGDLLALLNPYALMSGATFCAMFLWHGALWLAHKTEGELHARAVSAARRLWALVVIFGVLFVIANIMETQLAANYFAGLPNLLLLAVPAAAVLALITNRVFIAFGQWFEAWQASGVTLFAVLFACLIGTYPRMIPSLISPHHSLTAFNAASGPATLNIMFVVVVVMVPIILLYQRWAYGVFGEKVSQQEDELYY